MGTGQMMLVLLTVVLFTSIMSSTMANLTNQLEYLVQTVIILQGEKIAHKYVNLIDFQLKSKHKTFAQIFTDYQSINPSITVSGIQNSTFNVNITMQYCTDSTGNTVSAGATNFQRVNIWMSTVFGTRTLQIGTAANPIQSVFTVPVL